MTLCFDSGRVCKRDFNYYLFVYNSWQANINLASKLINTNKVKKLVCSSLKEEIEL